ncbi:MAG TPA: hypothetical protein VGK99_09620 [Acidobacteriota bacterium]
MSERYVLLARVGKKLQLFSLITNEKPTSIVRIGYRMLKAKCGEMPVKILMVLDLPTWVSDVCHAGPSEAKTAGASLLTANL